MHCNVDRVEERESLLSPRGMKLLLIADYFFNLGYPRLYDPSSYNSSPTPNAPHIPSDISYRSSTADGCKHGSCYPTAEARNQWCRY